MYALFPSEIIFAKIGGAINWKILTEHLISILRFRNNLREMEALFSEVLAPDSVPSSDAGEGGAGEEKKGDSADGVGRRLYHFLFHTMASSLATAPAGGIRRNLT